MFRGKVIIIPLIDGKLKKIVLFKIKSYYPEPDSHSRNKINVELDLSNYM